MVKIMVTFQFLLTIVFFQCVEPDGSPLLKTRPISPYLKQIRIYFWRPKSGAKNFGDELSPVVVSKMLDLNSNRLCKRKRSKTRTGHLLAIGSIMNRARPYSTIWGSGVRKSSYKPMHNLRNLDVRAVRGPLTRKVLKKHGIAVPEVYGDPALLLPYFYPRKMFKGNTQPKLPYVIVPHFKDLTIARRLGFKNVVSPLKPWSYVVSRILGSELVISSSLHGLIIAEAYGIPARRLKLQNIEKDFKYRDYVLGTGRNASGTGYAKNLKEAFQMGGMPPIPEGFDHTKLLESFPLDLWTRHCSERKTSSGKYKSVWDALV